MEEKQKKQRICGKARIVIERQFSGTQSARECVLSILEREINERIDFAHSTIDGKSIKISS